MSGNPKRCVVPKVLLVEDNKLTRMVNERSLAKAGYRVVSATDGEEALEVAAREKPDVVLLDMMLPKLSGQEVLKGLKRNPATAKIPVVVLTGLSQKNQARLLDDGAKAFVEKNAALENPALLLNALREALKPEEVAAENKLFTQKINLLLPPLLAH
jgi:two-component system phosphate regulon response regulator PhoB